MLLCIKFRIEKSVFNQNASNDIVGKWAKGLRREFFSQSAGFRFGDVADYLHKRSKELLPLSLAQMFH